MVASPVLGSLSQTAPAQNTTTPSLGRAAMINIARPQMASRGGLAIRLAPKTASHQILCGPLGSTCFRLGSLQPAVKHFGGITPHVVLVLGLQTYPSKPLQAWGDRYVK